MSRHVLKVVVEHHEDDGTARIDYAVDVQEVPAELGEEMAERCAIYLREYLSAAADS